MKYIPHKYQDFCATEIINNTAMGLFLGMGLGKTVITLTAIQEIRYNLFDADKILIIAPLKVAQNTWPAEIKKWDHLNHLSYSLILGTVKQRYDALNADADIYIINRDNVEWLLLQFGKYIRPKNKQGYRFTSDWPFDMVVIDELSSFKSQSARRWKMLKKARPFIERIIGLTGTPAPNGLIDLWAQIYLLDGGARLGATESAYRSRYFIPADYTRNGNGQLVITKYLPISEQAIYDKISDLCISMSPEDYIDMPDRIDNIVSVDLGKKLMSDYKELARECILELGDDILDAGSAAAISNKLQQFTQGAVYLDDKQVKDVHTKKLEALDDLIEQSNGNPVMVLYWYKFDRDRLKARYTKKYRVREMRTDSDIDAWDAKEVDILLLHPASAGHGLNLQKGGHVMVWYSLTWSLELYQQAIARLYRQGQAESVINYHIVAAGTVDEKILDVLQGKATKQDQLMSYVKVFIDK